MSRIQRAERPGELTARRVMKTGRETAGCQAMGVWGACCALCESRLVGWLSAKCGFCMGPVVAEVADEEVEAAGP